MTITVNEVTQDALIKRVNRRLAKCLKKLHTARDSRVVGKVGKHFVVATYSGEVLQTHVDVEEYAREIRAMAKWEVMRQGEAT